jgi:hypothetical protein
MAAGNTALLSARRMRWARSRPTAVIAVLAAIALAAVTSMVGRELVSIQSLAADVQSVVLPQITARQQRAIWIESLRSAASVVVYAPDRTTRHQALAKAEQLAANVTHADVASRAALDDAWESIRLAARKADEAQRVDQQMRAMLSEADSMIGDMSANLSSIVDDSGATIARVIKEALTSSTNTPPSRQMLEEVLAINTTSHELLASLDRGRIILTSALSLESDEELTSAETHFVAIGSQLQARVNTLRGNSDYEYLPEMIERFRRLDALFSHQRTRLALEQEAIAASASAKLRLSVVRETLAADAAGAAEASVAKIATSASRIKLTAAAMVMILIVAVAVLLKRNWQAGRAAAEAEAHASPQGPGLTHALSEGTLRATTISLENLIKAQGNLEHWRQTLTARLSGAVGSALHRLAEHPDEGVGMQPSGAADGETGTGDDDLAEDPILPPELRPCLTRVVGLIGDVAAHTSLIGLKASLDGVRQMAGESPPAERLAAQEEADAGPPTPTAALAAAARAADAVTERVGTTIGQINTIAPQPERDVAEATADIVRMVAQLGDQLSAIRDGDWQQPSYAG